MLNLETLIKALDKAKTEFKQTYSSTANQEVIDFVSKSGKNVTLFFDNYSPTNLLKKSSILNKDEKGLNAVYKNYCEDQNDIRSILKISKFKIGPTGSETNYRDIEHGVGNIKKPYEITNKQSYYVKNTPVFKTTNYQFPKI